MGLFSFIIYCMEYGDKILSIGEDYAKQVLDIEDATLDALMDMDADDFMDVGSHAQLSEQVKLRCLSVIKYMVEKYSI